MKIAVLGIKDLPASAGADRVVEKLLENFSADHEYSIYIRRQLPDVSHVLRQSSPAHLHYIEIPSLSGKHLGAFSFFFMCCMHYLFKGSYDLAHAHNSDFGFFVPLLRLKPGVSVLGTFHGDPYTRNKWGRFARIFLQLSERFFVQFCHRLTSVSKFKRSARGLFGGKTIDYIPNGVDSYWNLELDDGFDFAGQGLNPGEYIFFACGRLDSTKGLHHLLQAYLSGDFPQPLLVVGDFGHDPVYSAKVDAMMAGDDRIHAHRSLVGRSVLIDLIRNCRLFVFPSEYEAMSMMLLEVISCRKPIVCSDIPENAEVIGRDYPYLYPTFDPDELGRKMQEALNDSGLDDRMAALYEQCMQRYGWPEVAGEYEALYSELATR